MSTYDVIDANRKVKRDIQKVFGDNFLKIITEIILNSDDSYNRLAVTDLKKSSTFGRINIYLDRKKRLMRVLDQAEGMSLPKMRQMFREYGGDYSGSTQAKNVRGLFGQGASDVLFLSAFYHFPSFIITVYGEKASKCTFIFKNQKKIQVEELRDVDKVRQETGIINNGTLVVFGLPESVKVPKQKEIKEKIESFYMLRYILSSKNRNTIFYDGDLKHRLNSSKYLYHDQDVLLKKKAIKLSLDDIEVKSTLMLYQKKPSDIMQVIIKDENDVVFEETLFGLEKIHGASYIAGEYTIEGIGDILRNYLNKDKPEEILRDSRDGFDRRHRFTINMMSQVSNVLLKVIEDNNVRRESVSYSLNNNKKLFSALRKINRYFQELELSNISGINAGKNPPPEGIRFARPVISITRGKLYGLHLYINATQVNQNQEITLDIEKNPFVEIGSKEIMYSKKDIKHDAVAMKNVLIKAHKITKEPVVLKAIVDKYQSTVLINVVKEKVIYPENGLEFIPKRKTLSPGRNSYFSLYFDTAYIPLKSSILIEQHYESMLFPESLEFYTKESDLITETIGMIKIPIESHEYDERISIKAKSFDIVAEAFCFVKERNDTIDGSEGILNKIELVFDEGDWQATMIEGKGILQINGQHLINRKNMGPMGHKDPNNPTFDDKQLSYLYELVALESSKLYVIEKYKEHTDLIEPRAMFEEIQEHKSKVYQGLIEKE